MRLCNKSCLFWLIASSWMFAPGAWANDTEGLFVGVRFGHELADANYVKSVHYDANAAGVPAAIPDGTSMTGEDSANDGFNAFSANLGYRAFLSDRVYLSGEVEGAVYSNAVQGFFEGTHTGEERPIPPPPPPPPPPERLPRSLESGQEPQPRGQCTIGVRARGTWLPGRRPLGVPDFGREVVERDL